MLKICYKTLKYIFIGFIVFLIFSFIVKTTVELSILKQTNYNNFQKIKQLFDTHLILEKEFDGIQISIRNLENTINDIFLKFSQIRFVNKLDQK